MSAQDFLLIIEGLAENKLRVNLADSGAAEKMAATQEVPMPFNADDIARVVGLLDGTLRATRGDATKAARAFGEKLFTTVISGPIYTAFNSARQKGDVRLRLNLDNAEALAEWPWELLRDPNGDFLALSPQTPVMRSPRAKTTRPVKEANTPLRALALVASPSDQEPLDVEAEWRLLQDATASVRGRGLLKLERADDGQLNTLQRELGQGTNFQIFHYVGYSLSDEKSGAGNLAFIDARTDKSEAVSGDALARELSAEHNIRLMVMNACQTPRQKRKDPFAQIASDIVAGGVPAVVAMQVPLSDEATKLFSREFYKALSEGYPIETALTEGRKAIASSTGSLEWATPALFFGGTSGVLFPKRALVGERLSYGGLRDALLRPSGLIAVGVAALILVLALLFVVSASNPPASPTRDPNEMVLATLTPTPQGAKRNFDLVPDIVRYLPSNPAPGQDVKIALRFTNRGTSDTGPFKWGWWLDDPTQNDTPTIQGTVANLSPGLSTTFSVSYRLPWWGKFTTSVVVNFDNSAPEANIFNNSRARDVFVDSQAPFVVDFSVLPDGSIVEAGPLRGTEFAAWGFSLKAEPTTTCPTPQLQYVLDKNAVSQLMTANETGQTAPNSPCVGVPVTFLLNTLFVDQPIGSMSLDFLPSVAGQYALDVFGTNNQLIKRETLQITNTNEVRQLVISAPTGSFNQARVVFSVPQGGTVAIRRVTFKLPSQ